MDLFLRIILILLSFFVPLSCAGTFPWAFSLLQGGICALLAGILFSGRKLVITPLFKPVVYTLGILTLYSLVQCITTQTLLMPPAWYPATLMRLYTLEHISYFVTYLGWVFVVMQLVDNSQTAGRAVLWLGLCAVTVTLTAWCLAKGEYIYILTGIRGGYGPFLNRNHGGIFLAANAVLCLGWVCARFAQLSLKQNDKKSFWVWQFWGLLVSFGIGVAAVFSRSRGGMLSLAVGLFFLSVTCALSVPTAWKRRLRYLLLTLVLFGGGAYLTCTHLSAIHTFAKRSSVHDTSIETRKILYRAGRKMLHDYPVWGIGVGALPVVVTSYLEKPIPAYVERLHSDWLEMLVGLGYMGGVWVMGGCIWFGIVVFRRLSRLKTEKRIKLTAAVASLLAICTGALADFPFFIPATALLFFWGVGLACSPCFWKDRLHSYYPPTAVRIIIIVVMLATCIIPLQKTLAWRMFVFGKNLRTETRLQYYQRGLSYYPGPRFALRLGNAYYNASLREEDPSRQDHLRELAHQIAVTYLKKYPQEKELSRLYMRTQTQDVYPTK